MQALLHLSNLFKVNIHISSIRLLVDGFMHRFRGQRLNIGLDLPARFLVGLPLLNWCPWRGFHVVEKLTTVMVKTNERLFHLGRFAQRVSGDCPR